MKETTLVLKIDVDTERGTRIGVPQLGQVLKDFNIPATFLFSLGPDHTGRAIQRVFRPGFFKKVSRTSIVDTYGLRTLLNGVLLPGPFIGKKHSHLMHQVQAAGFDIGIHSYDHQKWQDNVHKMSSDKIKKQFDKAIIEFERIFETSPLGAGAPGWQANEKTLMVYDEAHLVYGSDCRGSYPFFPQIGQTIFNHLQIPTTLPTLDELIGLPEYGIETLTHHYLTWLQPHSINIMTIHAELEGMKYLEWFKTFLKTLKEKQVEFQSLISIAHHYLADRPHIPVCEMIQGIIQGRSGTLALQKLKS